MKRLEKNIVVMESDPAVRFALQRVALGEEIQLQFPDPPVWATYEGNCIAVLADDTMLQGTGDKLPLTLLKERLSGCPIILMTNTGNRRIEGFAREAGATAVLYKPFTAGELRKQIGKIVGSAEFPLAKAGSTDETVAPEPSEVKYTPVDFGGQIAGDQVFDELFVELEKRQPLEEGLDAFDVVERHLVKRALQACEGNQSQAARFLGITRNTLRKRIKKYGFSSLLSGDDSVDTEPE